MTDLNTLIADTVRQAVREELDKRLPQQHQQDPEPNDDLLTTDEAAAYLGLSPYTLRRWRSDGNPNPKHHKVGRLVRYRKSDLDTWLTNN